MRFVRVRENLGWYHRGREVDTYRFAERVYRRKLWLHPSWPRSQVRSVLNQWDTLCLKPEFWSGLERLVRGHKRRTLMDCPIEADGWTFLPKYYVYPTWLHNLQSSLYYSEARRNYATSAYLWRQGVGVPKPLAVLDLFRFGVIRASVLFTERLEERFTDYMAFVRVLLPGPKSRRALFFDVLGRELGRLHRSGIYAEDTYKNTMVDPTGDGFRFIFLDFDNVFPWRLPNFRRTAKCLTRFLAPAQGLSRAEFQTFLEAYVDARDLVGWRDRLEEAVAARVVRPPP